MKSESAHLDEFIDTWLVHSNTGWTALELHDACGHDPERAWKLICAIVERDLNDSQMARLGAGPIESLMIHHGAQFIDRLEALAASNETFRGCLKRAYPVGPTNEIKRRMGIASGVSWVDYSGEHARISPVLIRYNRELGLRVRDERGEFVGMAVTQEPTDTELVPFGFALGDLIVSADGVHFTSATHARELLVELVEPRAVRFEVIRGGERVTLARHK